MLARISRQNLQRNRLRGKILSEYELAVKKRADRGFRSQNIHSRHFIDKILKTRGLPVDGSHRRRGMTSPGSCSKDVKDRFGAPPPERRKLMQELLAVTSILAGGVKL
jgi:hypothetical protein